MIGLHLNYFVFLGEIMIGEAVSCDNPAAPTNGGFADAAEYRISSLDISEVNQTESVQDMKDEWDETSEEETEPEDSQEKSAKSPTEKSAKIVGVESFNVAEESSNVDDINDTVEGESVPILEAVSENTGDMENQANDDTNNVAVSEQQDQDSSVDAVTESKDNGEAAKESANANKAADNNMAAPESINTIEKVSPKESGETIAAEKGSCEDLAVEKAVAADEKAATEGAAVEKAVIEGAAAEKAVIEGAAVEEAVIERAAAEKAVIEAVAADKIPQTDGLEDEDIKVSFILYF